MRSCNSQFKRLQNIPANITPLTPVSSTSDSRDPECTVVSVSRTAVVSGSNTRFFICIGWCILILLGSSWDLVCLDFWLVLVNCKLNFSICRLFRYDFFISMKKLFSPNFRENPVFWMWNIPNNGNYLHLWEFTRKYPEIRDLIHLHPARGTHRTRRSASRVLEANDQHSVDVLWWKFCEKGPLGQEAGGTTEALSCWCVMCS